jgi:hypothetical protein
LNSPHGPPIDEQTFEAVAAAWVAVRKKRDGWTAGYVREVENSIDDDEGMAACRR